MVKVWNAQFRKEDFLRLAEDNERIRNVCVFAPLDEDKASIVESLVSAPGVINPDTTCGFLNHDAEDGPPQWLNMSLCYDMGHKFSGSDKDERQDTRFLVNVIYLPRHANPSVDLNTKSFLRHVLCENIRPVLCLDLMDESCFSDEVSGEDVYNTLFSLIKGCNAILEKDDNKLLGDVNFYPEKGNVIFSCCSSGWGFTLATFAQIWSNKLNVPTSELLEKLWGANFYDLRTRKWTKHYTGSKWCKRGFVHFCYDTIKKAISCSNKGELKNLSDIIGRRVRPDGNQELAGEELVKQVMREWIPIGTALIDSMILHVPSPKKAQEYRVEHLYEGPLNDDYATAIRCCAPSGLTVLYISKLVRASETGELLAVGRIFSGSLHRCAELCVVGLDNGHKTRSYVKSFKGPILRVGRNEEYVDRVSCGNLVALAGLDGIITMNVTLVRQNKIAPFPVRAIGHWLMSNKNIRDIMLKDTINPKGKNLTIPYDAYSSLYLHQREGIRWLWSRRCKNDGGGILADDMGLGKTKQVSTFLCGLLQSKFIIKAIIVAPSSVIDHWKPELLEVGLTGIKFDNAQDPTQSSLKSFAKDGGILLASYDSYRIHESLILAILAIILTTCLLMKGML